MSSWRRTVPLVLEAPTVITHGALPGEPMAPYCGWPFGGLAEVAGRGDDDDAGVDGALGRERQRIGRVRLGHARRRATG